MEGFRFENSKEKNIDVNIILQNKEIQYALVGRPISAGVKELIKAFAIMNNIVRKEVSTENQAAEMILDLWDEFNVKIFEPDDIFCKKVIKQLLEAKQITSLSVDINDGPIVIEKDSSVESIMNNWETELEKRQDQGKDGLESQNKQRQEEVKSKQQLVDSMFSQLEIFDFQNLKGVIEWLYQYNKSIDDVDVNGHIEEVAKKFEEQGYRREANDNIDFILAQSLKDKNKYGEVIVGYMLENLSLFHSDSIEKWIENWENL